jgi:hypothetical protein
MPDVLLVCAAALALVAVVAAVVAVRAVRRLERTAAELRDATRPAPVPPAAAPDAVTTPEPAREAHRRVEPVAEPVPVVVDEDEDDVVVAELVDDETEVRVVDGRVVVRPSDQQVVAATLGRPLVRLSVLGAGLAHALRPESRDRIAGLVRRDFRRRRRARARAARRAARTTTVPPAAPPTWIGRGRDGGAP